MKGEFARRRSREYHRRITGCSDGLLHGTG